MNNNRYKPNPIIESIKVILIIAAIILLPMLLGYAMILVESHVYPLKCTTDYSGERFCKQGNGEWIPQ